MSTFSISELNDFIDMFSNYLSFCRGAWVAPVLNTGYAENEERTWLDLRIRRVERWMESKSWSSFVDSEIFFLSLPGFVSRWKQECWKEPLKLGLHWYMASNSQGEDIETSIIIGQA